jgi:hypothetical protein
MHRGAKVAKIALDARVCGRGFLVRRLALACSEQQGKDLNLQPVKFQRH